MMSSACFFVGAFTNDFIEEVSIIKLPCNASAVPLESVVGRIVDTGVARFGELESSIVVAGMGDPIGTSLLGTLTVEKVCLTEFHPPMIDKFELGLLIVGNKGTLGSGDNGAVGIETVGRRLPLVCVFVVYCWLPCVLNDVNPSLLTVPRPRVNFNGDVGLKPLLEGEGA